MKSAKILGALLLAGIIVAGLGVVLPVSTVTSSVETKGFDPIPAESEIAILDATVQIFLYPQDQPPGELVYERGLGTLVYSGGEYLVYTHDHWGYINYPGKIEFRNAQAELLLEINGEQFSRLIRYQDRGNLVLSAPIEIHPDYLAALINLSEAGFQRPLVAVNLTQPLQPAVGDQVVVVRRAQEDRSKLELLPVYIEELSEADGVFIYRLRSQEGEVIIPGDSGGGVWLNGTLIGNMWWSEYIYNWQFWQWDSLQPERKYLNQSAGAGLPEVLAAHANAGPLPTANNKPAGLLGGEMEE